MSPGSPYKIGVQKPAKLAGVALDDKQVNAAASAAPYTLGIAGGLLDVGLRRLLHLRGFLGHLTYAAGVAVTAEVLMD